MSTDNLTQTLNQLQEELTNTKKLDENSVKLLQSVLDDIRLAIERSGKGSGVVTDMDEVEIVANEESNSIGVRLRGLITAFEAEHPKLTSSLSQIAEFLAEIGI